MLAPPSCLTLCDPVDCGPQSPLFMGFSRQKYWNELPCPSPGDLPDPGIKPQSPALQAGSLPSETQGILQTNQTRKHALGRKHIIM